MDDMGFQHIASSPHYHQSNGLAEECHQLVKNLLYKAKESGKDLYTALICYRNPHLCHDLTSPMELLWARQARSDLPMSHTARMQVKQAVTKQLVTRSSSESISPKSKDQAQAPSNLLATGTHVMCKTPPSKLWYLAVSTNILQDGQSYIINIRWSHI